MKRTARALAAELVFLTESAQHTDRLCAGGFSGADVNGGVAGVDDARRYAGGGDDLQGAGLAVQESTAVRTIVDADRARAGSGSGDGKGGEHLAVADYLKVAGTSPGGIAAGAVDAAVD